jgi:hypothetical protein
MLAGGPSAAEIFLTAAAAAGAPAVAQPVAASSTWRTGARQPGVFVKKDAGMQYHLMIRYAPFKGAKKEQQRRVYSATEDGYNHPGWATREAAEAARVNFKAWVDTGMNAGKRAGAAASASARSATSPATPASRHSSRVNVVCSCCRLAVCALVTGAASNSTIEWVPMNASEAEAVWRERSERMLKFSAQARQWRQQRAVAEARACVSDGEWEQFLERCRKVSAADEASGLITFRSKRHRGKGRARLTSQRSKARSDRHVQRREHRLTQQACSVQYSTAQYSIVRYSIV